MAYVSYTGLNNPNEVLEKMADFIVSKGYTIAKSLGDDLNIYDKSNSDGKKFCFVNRTNEYYIVLRSANGTNIFGTMVDSVMSTTTPDKNDNYYGIGMTVGEGYSDSARWYNQYNSPVKHNDVDIQAVFIPVPNDGRTYTLYCNEVTKPTYSITFSVMPDTSIYRPCVHLVYADIDKYETWTGGAFFSGSSTRYQIEKAHTLLSDTYSSDDDSLEHGVPILTSSKQSNSFLRINIDDAPTSIRGNILWASSGTDNITGKPMALALRTSTDTNGQIPNYYYLQSQSRLDWGKDVNILNCITLNMPIFVAVQVDPDILQNYAAVGVIPGISFISMLNMQTSYVYELNTPESNDFCQVFSLTKRRGSFGFDGISIIQEAAESE